MGLVRSLGYAIVEATDLDAWAAFGADLLGLQIAVRTDDRIEFRMDHKEYRFIVEKSERNGARVIGWEVGGPADLDEVIERLTAEGYDVTRHTRDEARMRRVTALASFADPEGEYMIELHYGLREAMDPFVSPTGAVFKTGNNGFGHFTQVVSDHARTSRLYFDIFGFRLSDHIAMGDEEITFTHCNPRHHSFGFSDSKTRRPGLGHFMFEPTELDVIGRAWDKVTEENAAPILSTIGKHSNDKMVSFYVRSPSGFGIEYGTGGIEIDDATWTPTRYNEAHYWGHHRATPPSPTDPVDAGE